MSGGPAISGFCQLNVKLETRKLCVQAKHIPDTAAETLQAEIRKRVQPGSTVYTDELKSYQGLVEYVHEVINHSFEYVRGHIYTNGIENFWTLFKRSIKGTYTFVDPRHLGRYISEQVFRFNERERTDKGRLKEVAARIDGKRLTIRL